MGDAPSTVGGGDVFLRRDELAGLGGHCVIMVFTPGCSSTDGRRQARNSLYQR